MVWCVILVKVDKGVGFGIFCCTVLILKFSSFILFVAVTLCFVALFIQRTAPATCPGPCHGSSNGLLGD